MVDSRSNHLAIGAPLGLLHLSVALSGQTHICGFLLSELQFLLGILQCFRVLVQLILSRLQLLLQRYQVILKLGHRDTRDLLLTRISLLSGSTSMQHLVAPVNNNFSCVYDKYLYMIDCIVENYCKGIIVNNSRREVYLVNK